MTATITTITDALKEHYAPAIESQFNEKKLLMKLLSKNKRVTGGRDVYLPVITARTHAYGARAESGTLPTASNVSYDVTKPAIKYNYAKISLTGPSMSASRSNKFAFVRALNAEVVGATEGMLNDVNRQCFGDGSGIITRCATTSSSTTVNVDSTEDLEIGMVVDILVASSGATITNGSAATILTIPSATTFTVASAVTTDTTHCVYVAGSRNNVMMGLKGIVSDQNPGDIETSGVGNLQEVAVSGNPWWTASELDASGVNRALTLELMHDTVIDLDKSSGLGHELDCIITTHELWKKYGLLLTPDRRYGGDPDVFEGGWKYLTFDGLKIFFDRQCQDNRMYFLNLDHLILFEERPVGWADFDNSLLKWDGSTDTWVAFLAYYATIGTDRRNAHAVLKDLTQ